MFFGECAQNLIDIAKRDAAAGLRLRRIAAENFAHAFFAGVEIALARGDDFIHSRGEHFLAQRGEIVVPADFVAEFERSRLGRA